MPVALSDIVMADFTNVKFLRKRRWALPLTIIYSRLLTVMVFLSINSWVSCRKRVYQDGCPKREDGIFKSVMMCVAPVAFSSVTADHDIFNYASLLLFTWLYKVLPLAMVSVETTFKIIYAYCFIRTEALRSLHLIFSNCWK